MPTETTTPVVLFRAAPHDSGLGACSVGLLTCDRIEAYAVTLVATPTPMQAQAFARLAVDPTKL